MLAIQARARSWKRRAEQAIWNPVSWRSEANEKLEFVKNRDAKLHSQLERVNNRYENCTSKLNVDADAPLESMDDWLAENEPLQLRNSEKPRLYLSTKPTGFIVSC